MPRRPQLEVIETPKGFKLEVPASLSASGKRERFFCQDSKAAKKHATGVLKAYHERGIQAGAINPALASDAMKAELLLAPFGVSILDVVREYVNRNDHAGARLTVGEAWTAYEALLVKKKRSDATLLDYKRDRKSLPDWFFELKAAVPGRNPPQAWSSTDENPVLLTNRKCKRLITVNQGIAPPVWSSDPVTEANATEDSAYSSTLSNNVTDVNGGTMTFTKVSGPTWLSVATNGNLSGTPINSNVGLNTFTVRVTDGNTAPVQATVNITVINSNDAPTFTQNPIYTPPATRYAAYASSIASYAQDIDVGASLVFAKTGGPAWLIVAANGDLSGTPSTGDLGTNTFTVTVSDGIAAPVSATLPIKVNATDPAAPAIYEPFADNDPFLLGNTPGAGLTGTWLGSANATVDSPSLFFGALPTKGNWLKLPGNEVYASTGNTLSNLGLLANGATLWFSFLLDSDDRSNANHSMSFSLGTSYLTRNMANSMANSGSGIGISWDRGGAFKGAYWDTSARTSSTTSAGNSKNLNLVVASVTWGADDTANETLSIYLPNASLTLPASPAVTFTIPARAQSIFKTISFGNRTDDGLFEQIDEIRFGSSYDSVTGQVQITGDSTPPTLAGSAIVDDRGGATVAAGSVVTYTMTFSEDMNAATVGADDFANAGNSAITIGSIVETSPGVFTVQATPTTAGTLRLQVAAGAFLADMAGNLLNTASAIPDDTTINVAGGNSAPVWTNNPVNEVDATKSSAYASTLADNASDANSNPLTFAKVGGPAWLNVASNGNLSGTPGNSDVGANVFTVSVTDGIAPAVQATLNILVNATASPPAVVYEPFADSDSTLSGNAPGTGLRNTWSSTAASITTNLTYGSLPTSGNSVATTAGGSGWNNSSVALATTGTTLSSAGLLNHGAQMWFSVLLRRDTSGARFAMSIGDSGFSTNGDLTPLASQGIGFGVVTDNKIYASVWETENWGATNLGGPPASWISGSSVLPLGQLKLVVGKVEWGANGTAKDRVTLYLPGTDLVMGSPVAVAEGVVSQEDGSFDTLALHAIASVSHSFDEIRFGSSYAAVAAVGDAYTTWATSFSLENPWVTLANPALNGEPAADPDGDGVTNKGEYAFGLNSTSGASSNPIVSQLDKTTGKFSYTRRATPASTGIVYTVTTSPDLVAWPNDNPATAGQVVTGTVDGVETVEVTLTGAPLTGSKRFVQIKAE